MPGWDDSLFNNLPAPTAQPNGWWDTLFGNPSRRAVQPSSRGALLGANYQGMPDTKASVTDRRQDYPYAGLMQNAPGVVDNSPYLAQPVSVPAFQGSDPMVLAANTVDPNQPADVAPYQPSFQQNWRPGPTGQAPYRPSPVGPSIPRGYDPSAPYDAGGYQASKYQLPYIGAHLPISPGDPGWTPPPSPSGPHNPQGDPARPGYGDIFSSPQSAFSPQQLTAALRAWGGWQ